MRHATQHSGSGTDGIFAVEEGFRCQEPAGVHTGTVSTDYSQHPASQQKPALLQAHRKTALQLTTKLLMLYSLTK